MRRVLAVMAIAAICGGVAFGGTLFVPLINDYGGPVNSNVVPSWGEASYFRLLNASGATVDVTIEWFNAITGVADQVHTATLTANEILSYRPYGWQGILPDTGVKTTAGALVGKVTWSGTGTMVGNVVVINNNGSRGMTTLTGE